MERGNDTAIRQVQACHSGPLEIQLLDVQTPAHIDRLGKVVAVPDVQCQQQGIIAQYQVREVSV